MRLADKVCLVTGTAEGIGFAIAQAFAREGARVIGGDIQEEKNTASAAAITKAGPGAAWALRCDVRSTSDLNALAAFAVEKFGRIDVLVNNAAVAMLRCITDMTDEAWSGLINTNLTGVFRGCRAVIPAMLQGGGGSIINIASVHGYVGWDGFTGYAAAKGGILAMTRQLAKEFGPKRIRVNSISPGAILTPLNFRRAAAEAPGQEEAYLAKWAHLHALERNGTPEEVAAAAVYLASEESSFVTGIDLKVDGGLTVCPRE